MTETLFAQAYAALERNELALLEQLCRQALQAAPRSGEALHLLGIAARRQERPAEAVALMREAWRRDPSRAEIANNLTALLCAIGAHVEALEAADLGLARHPDFAFLHANRGIALHGCGRAEDAAEAFRRTLATVPDLETALFGLATTLEALNRQAEAEPVLRQLLAHHPGHVEATNLLGRVLAALDRPAEAAEAFLRTTVLAPHHGQAFTNLASMLLKLDRVEEALAAARRAVELDPASPLAHNNASIICQELVRLDEAIAYSRRSVALQPNNVDAHWCLGLQLLYAGQWAEGWQEYEWRWRLPFHRMMGGPPVWAGQILGANALLVTTEQGQGDSLQFLRYVPMLAPYCSNIILRVQNSLKRLVQASLPDVTVIDYDDPIPPVPFQVPLMSLPRLLGTNSEAAIPRPIPYLRNDPAAVLAWRERLKDGDGVKRIGIAWRGSPTYKRDHLRSIGLEMLEPLLSQPNCRFYALHPDIREEERPILSRFNIQELSAGLSDFADTAALLENLDLVIAVDTSVVHLAGALGRPVWAMLPFSCDWRWGKTRTDSPWYPSLRLFRQKTARQWGPVIAEMTVALERAR